jgi:hypothetical protein
VEIEIMKKWCIWMLVCLVGISACAATGESTGTFAATLPDGNIVELIGLRNYSIRDLEKFKDRNYPWWRPDGTALTEPPDIGSGRTSSGNTYWFVMRVEGNEDCDFKAVGPYDVDLTVQPVRRKAQGFDDADLRYFTLRFSPSQTQGDIKLGVACGDWQIADRWSIEPDWTPYNGSIGSSDQLILRCPEQVGSDVVTEVTQIITERTTRLVLFDRDGNQYESAGETGGKGVGLVRYVHRFRNMDKKNIEHIEFQVRPYQFWITFSNVSLQAEHKTQVKVDIKQPGTLLKGDALPEFDNIKIDFTTEDNKGRRLLICFFDMNQRPSRNCINELSKRTGQLKEKDVAIIAAQALKISQDSLDEWTKENSISFPVGIIERDMEKTSFAWGVRSLPWLILTDRRHLVIDAGFGLGELDDKLNAAN